MLKKLAILAAILFVFDRGLGMFLDYCYNKNPPPDVQAFNRVVKTPSEDIFVFGSSKAAHGYVSDVFSDSLGLTCFNAGREKTNILYAEVVMNAMLKKHSPKIVILDINAKETVATSMEASKLVLANLLLPYISTDTSIQHLGKKLFPKEMLTSELSELQRFNSQILPLLMGTGKQARVSQNGYIPAHGSKVLGDLPSFEDRGEQYDTSAKSYFENFIRVLQARNIKLYVVQSPYLVQKFTTSVSLAELKPIMKKYNVQFLDYSFDPDFFKREYFYDYVHLNDKGAHAFSEKLASDIKKDLEKSDPAFANKLQTVER